MPKRLFVIPLLLLLVGIAGCQTVKVAKIYGNGEKYVGDSKNDKRHGRGTYTFANGNKYVGDYRKGFRHGQGTHTYANGDEYVGSVRRDKRNGLGTYTSSNGDKYTGKWRNDLENGQGTRIYADGRIEKGRWKNGEFLNTKIVGSIVVAGRAPSLNTTNPPTKSVSTGSGFFVSKLGYFITNQHVVDKCKRITLGENANRQATAIVVEADQPNDLALLRLSNMNLISAETKSLVAKLGLKVSPSTPAGLFRLEGVELGEHVLVAGFPFADLFSNTVKVTRGIVSAKRGIGDDSGQFQIDAAVQSGSSGGPIYDDRGNVIGVTVAQLNKLNVAKNYGSLPENSNFGIKASTVMQFLASSGVLSKWSKRTKRIPAKEIAKIAQNQTLMVICHR